MSYKMSDKIDKVVYYVKIKTGVYPHTFFFFFFEK